MCEVLEEKACDSEMINSSDSESEYVLDLNNDKNKQSLEEAVIKLEPQSPPQEAAIPSSTRKLQPTNDVLKIGRVFYSFKPFKKRERNIAPAEKNILIKLFSKYPEIKLTDFTTESLLRKRRAWERLHREFVNLSPESSDRSIQFLRGVYKRFKVQGMAFEDDVQEVNEDPLLNIISALDQNAVFIAASAEDTPRSAQNENLSTVQNLPETSQLVSEHNKNMDLIKSLKKKYMPLKSLQRKSMELAVEAEKEKLAGYRFQKIAQKYAMMTEKVKYETELLKKEAAKIALEKLKSQN